MATRKRQKWRRQFGEGREPIGGRCEAAECAEPAVARVMIPDDGLTHRLCEQHALAVEMQLRRNAAAAEQKRLNQAVERLGIR